MGGNIHRIVYAYVITAIDFAQLHSEFKIIGTIFNLGQYHYIHRCVHSQHIRCYIDLSMQSIKHS